MDNSTKAFVERQNVARYIDLIKAETDPVRRELLLKLLAAEEAKQAKASAWHPSEVRASGTTG